MIGRRAVIGLSLLCALVFCAFGASSASAAKGMTVFECVEEAEGNKFTDADCDITGAGKFGHKEITKTVEIDTKQVSGTFTIGFNFLTILTDISCTTMTTTGSIENVAGPPMSVKGIVHITLSGCTVTKPAKCVVKQPIVINAAVKSVIINEAKEEHGLEYSPEVAGGNFTELTFENKGAEKCAITNGGKPVPVKGTAIGTGSTVSMTGGIQRFKSSEASMQKLTVAGEPATIEGEVTVTNKATNNALGLTTTAT